MLTIFTKDQRANGGKSYHGIPLSILSFQSFVVPKIEVKRKKKSISKDIEMIMNGIRAVFG